MFDAASISITSKDLFSSISLQIEHLTQTFLSLSSLQLIVLANILANEVLPTPLEPQKINACGIDSVFIKLFKTVRAFSWPTTSSKVFGLYFLDKTLYDISITQFFLSG